MFRAPVLILCLLVFAAFINLTDFTVRKFGMPLMPVLFAVGAFTVIFSLFKKETYPLKNILNKNNYAISFFLLVYLAFGLINADIKKGLTNEIYPLLNGFFIYYLVLSVLKEKKETDFVLLSIVLSGPLLVLQGISQLIYEISAGTVWTFRAHGWWGDPNAYAFILDLVYLVSFYFIPNEKKLLRWAGYSAQLSAAAGIFLSFSRGGIIVFLLLTLLHWRFFWLYRRYLKAVLVFAVVFYFTVIINIFDLKFIGRLPLSRLYHVNIYDYSGDGFFNNRLNAALTGMLIFVQNPLAGAGFGNILDYAEKLGQFRMYTHNLFVEILANSGIVPFTSFIYMLFVLWTAVAKERVAVTCGKMLGSFVVTLSAMGFFLHFLLYMKPVWIILAVFPVSFLEGGKNAPGNDNH